MRHAGGATPPMPRWIAHAGLGIARPGGSPVASTLRRARALGVDRVELDVCITSDRRLLLRHDTVTQDGLEVARLEFGDMCRLQPDLLTIDEGLEHLDGLPVLFDVKSDATAPVLAEWLRARRDASRFAVCTESRAALLELRAGAPRVERWRSFPDIGVRWREHIPRVGVALLHHRSPAHVAYLGREMATAARDLRRRRAEGLARVGGMPWREVLPVRLSRLCHEVAAAAICIHHWLLTPRFVETARTLGLPVAAWTVNDETALRRVLAGGGVDMVTTDEVTAMRTAWLAAAAAARRPRPALIPKGAAEGAQA